MSHPGSSNRYHLVERLFQSAMDLPQDRRAEFLKRECEGDDGLFNDVHRLVRNHDAAGDYLESPVLESAVLGGDSVPVRIGDYTVVGRLGRGGMGVVFEATQQHPQRSVAIKVIRPGAMSASALRRFEYEASVLGRLQHPGIAHIYEAGVAEVVDADGRTTRKPFFAMELVRGRSLLNYAAERGLNVTQRLKLFAELCDAVEHAHQKGVLHRDLKPANILVNEEGRPKVLDFGVAQITDADVRLTTMHTQVSQLIGTLAYMSPEQVGGRTDRLDTRSDVYSLGVVLFELITGRLPYDIADKPLAAAARVIEEGPPAPLVSTDRSLGADLATLVAKALEKDPARRYGSVGEFAADVRRCLRREPIVARPATALYQMRKFAQRNRPLVGGIAAAFAALVLGIIGTSYGMLQANQRRTEAEAARESERAQRIEAEKQRGLAERAGAFQAEMLSSIDIHEMGRGLRENWREQVRAVLEREQIGDWPDRRRRRHEEVAAEMAGFDDAMASVNPADVARRVIVQYVLKPAEQSLESQFADEPLVQARVQFAIGSTYTRTLGLHHEAQRHMHRALELCQSQLDESPHVAKSLFGLATAQHESGDTVRSEATCREALAMRRRLYGRSHPEVAESLNLLAIILEKQARLDEAEEAYRETLDVLREFPETAELRVAVLGNMALIVRDRGDLDAAEPLFHEALDESRRLFGEEHHLVATAVKNLASLHEAREDYEAAEPLYLEALEIRRRIMGDEHPRVAQCRRQLGRVRHKSGNLAAAEVDLRTAVEIYKSALGDNHPDVASCMGDLGKVLVAAGSFEEAEGWYRKAMGIHRRSLGDQHPYVATGLNNLAMIKSRQGDYDAGELLYREAIETYRNGLGDDHPWVAAASNNLALLLLRKGDFEGAEAQYRQALALCERRLSPSHPSTVTSRTGLGRSLTKQSRFAEAERQLLQAYESIADVASSPSRTTAIEGLIELCEARHVEEPHGGFDAKAAEWRALLPERSQP